VISPVTFGRAMARCVDRVRVTVLEQSSNAIGSANASAKAAALRAKVTPPPQVRWMIGVPMHPTAVSSRNWPGPPKVSPPASGRPRRGRQRRDIGRAPDSNLTAAFRFREQSGEPRADHSICSDSKC